MESTIRAFQKDLFLYNQRELINSSKSEFLKKATEDAKREVQVLSEQVKVLESDRKSAAKQVKMIEKEINTRAIKRVKFRVVYTKGRKSDAEEIVSLITELGGSVYLIDTTSDYGNEPHAGKAYYTSDIQLKAIQQITPVISDIQKIEPKHRTNTSDHITLWVSREQ